MQFTPPLSSEVFLHRANPVDLYRSPGYYGVMRPINPYQPPSRFVYCCQFRNPLPKKTAKGDYLPNQNTTASLQTSEYAIARQICQHLERLRDEKFTSAKKAVMAGLNRRAIEIYFAGTEQSAADILATYLGDLPEQSEVIRVSTMSDIRDRLVDLAPKIHKLLSDVPKADLIAALSASEEAYKISELTARVTKAETISKVLEPENTQLREDVRRLSRSQNKHVHVTMASAVAAWKKDYKQLQEAGEVTEDTYKQATSAVNRFVETLPKAGETQLASVTQDTVDNWVKTMRNALTGKLAAPPTRRTNKMYLASFYRFATVKYDLIENPMRKTGKVPGLDRHPDKIVALTSLAPVREILTRVETVKPHGWYWKTWCCVGMMAGLRRGEQIHLRLDDVEITHRRAVLRVENTDDHDTKTGESREVPIETTVCLPALRHYLEHVRPKLGNSKWLFPSIQVVTRPRKDETDPHKWTGSSLLRCLKKVLKQAAGNSTAVYWKYTNKVYRHCAGSLLFQAGWNALAISRFLGNSPDVCYDHYIKGRFAGHKLPLKFMGSPGGE